MNPIVIIYIIIFIFGIIVGSFLNVCIYRIPKRETIVTERSHCLSCSYQLRWYDLIPVISWLLLRGRCRQCKEKISIQYPLIEIANGILWVTTFLLCGFVFESILYCALLSALLVLSVIDFCTYEIPFGINVFILLLGIIQVVLRMDQWKAHVLGFCIVSGILLLLYLLTRGRGIGGGDIKLMAAAGLLLGWDLILLAFILGCFFGSVIHLIRMKIQGEGHVLAMGPYLSMGILVAAWFGAPILDWYSNLF